MYTQVTSENHGRTMCDKHKLTCNGQLLVQEWVVHCNFFLIYHGQQRYSWELHDLAIQDIEYAKPTVAALLTAGK